MAHRKWLSRNVLGFSLASLWSDLGHELVTALLPGFLLTIGAPPIALGLVEGLSNLASTLAKRWSGQTSDHLRDRRPLLLLGYLATALKALMALVGTWPWVVVIRTVAWIGRGSRGPIRDAVIADSVAPEDYGKAYGFRQMMDTVGAVLGPLAGFLLLSRLGYRHLFALSLLPALLALLSLRYLVQEMPGRKVRSVPSRGREALPPAFKRFLLAATVFATGMAPATFLILRATQLLSASHGSLPASSLAVALYTVHNLFYALGAYPAGALADRAGPRSVLIGGYILFAAALVGFSWGPTAFWPLVPLFALSGTATALVSTLEKALGSHLVPADIRGSALGVQGFWVGIGNLLSGLLLGGLWTLLRPGPAFAILAVMALTGVVLLNRRGIGDPA